MEIKKVSFKTTQKILLLTYLMVMSVLAYQNCGPGLVAFGKNRAVLQNVREGGFSGWEKTYETLVLGRLPPKGEINVALPARNGGGDVPALTKFRTIRLYKECAHVEALIESGKHHQIRKHFAKTGHPLLCDDVYGDHKMNKKFGKMLKIHHFFLHASHLKFPHPMTGVMVDVKDPLPPSFERALEKLRSLLGEVVGKRR
jgi:23S rRNA-/tRNA-specific pseudouridylate synthase